MRIAIPCGEEGKIRRDLSGCTAFRIFELEGQEILRDYEMPVLEPGEKGILSILAACRVDAVICCEAQRLLKLALLGQGYLLHSGVMGTVEQAARAFAAGNLPGKDGCSGGEEHCSGDCQGCGHCQSEDKTLHQGRIRT